MGNHPVTAELDIMDIHLHLLPGPNDGARTLDESLHTCELYVAQGVTSVPSHQKWNTGFRRTADLLMAGARQEPWLARSP